MLRIKRFSLTAFARPEIRTDVLTAMLCNLRIPGKDLFRLLMTDNANTSDDFTRMGWLYETICQIMILCKCVAGLDYTEIYQGQLHNHKPVKNVLNLLETKVAGGGRNLVDMILMNQTTLIPITVKYNNAYKETDVSKIDHTIQTLGISEENNYRIALFVKHSALVREHTYMNQSNIDKILHEKIMENGLLFDSDSIIRAIDVFRGRFSGWSKKPVGEFVDMLNADYICSPRKILVKKLHQELALRKFRESLLGSGNRIRCIAHKPRSGKSITILSMCKYLLETTKTKRILIMTSVPATIQSFISDLNGFVDFRSISYINQENMENIPAAWFSGVVFCSVQYLKTTTGLTHKKKILKNAGFDVIFTDESHQGSSTDKTKDDILSICENTRLCVFASGTSDKTTRYYGIAQSDIYEWEIEDEAYMKEIMKPDISAETRDEIIGYMTNRHGAIFRELLSDNTLNRDYTKHPTQVLMKHSICDYTIKQINEYNSKNNTQYGYSCSSLLALQTAINEKGEAEYKEEFALCKDNDGEDILTAFFECIISANRMKRTIMKQVEDIQTTRGSRKSSIIHPLLFIVYLPTHTRNNTIGALQKTMKKFLETHRLWCDYNIEYSNATEDTGCVKETYNDYIETILAKAKRDKKRGCVLLLGNKGSVGITYRDCDVTISLDDGHNIDNQKQRFSRALTEAEGKTVGINVDMNIQRTYGYLIDMIQRHRKITKTTKTNAEILYYLYEHNVFLFDPQEINNGKMTTHEIKSYFEKTAENMMREIDDTPFLEDIVCDDDMRDMICADFRMKRAERAAVCKDLEGNQQDCPKGEITKTEIDAPPSAAVEVVVTNKSECDGDDAVVVETWNQTYEMCKSFLFPLLALISRTYRIFNFKDIFVVKHTRDLVLELLRDKKIEIKNFSMFKDIMNVIIDNNAEIVNNIREIYTIAPANKLRELIEKHFIPSNDEKKQNAEVPTPVKLVDEMLDKIPTDFWKTPKKVFEPCCGKGNFVLGIFDRFYAGLSELYPDETERCSVIMNECIYYADLTALNVFITTEILKCHVQSYCGLTDFGCQFHSHVGDTLKLDTAVTFGVEGFDAVIGNPPYSTDPSKPDTKPLYDKFIEKYIEHKILLFVVPSRWFVGGKGLDGFRDMMMKRKDIVLIQHEDDSKKWFGKNIGISGGVNYFMKNNTHNGECKFNDIFYNLSKYDCIITPRCHAMVDFVKNKDSINNLYMGRYFGIETNDKRFTENGSVKCYVSLQKSKDRCKYLETYDFTDKNRFWKVITAEANGTASKGFGAIFIGKPEEIHTGSYISFRCQSEYEAKSLLSYLETKFANYMLTIRKISQHINGDVCKWIPLVPLDRIWSDKLVCQYFAIDSSVYM
jgi:site-specific DNA-methyltransferase (adenine-specific)